MKQSSIRNWGIFQLLLGISITVAFVYSTSSLLASYGQGADAAMWATIGVSIELAEVAMFIIAGIAAYLGYTLIRYTCFALYIPLAIIGVLTLAGKMSTIQSEIETQRIESHGTYTAAETKLNAANTLLSALKYTDLQPLIKAVGDAQADLDTAEKNLLRYASPDCTPKTDRKGAPFSSKAAEYCGYVSEKKALLNAAKTALQTAEQENKEFKRAAQSVQNNATEIANVSNGAGIKNGGVSSQFVIGSTMFFGLISPQQFRDGFIISVAVIAKALAGFLLYLGTRFLSAAPAPTLLERDQARLRRKYGNSVSLTHRQPATVAIPSDVDASAYLRGAEAALNARSKTNEYPSSAQTQAQYRSWAQGYADIVTAGRYGELNTLNPQPLNPENTPVNQGKTTGVEGVEGGLNGVDGLRVSTNSTVAKNTAMEQVIIAPHTRRGDYNLIHGGEGTGKTLLMLEMAHTVAAGGEMLGGAWKVETPETVLIVDGENGEARMEKRLNQMEIKHPNLHYVSNDQLPAEHYPHIHEQHGQQVIEKLLKDSGATFLILDNLGVLGDEAQKSSVKWADISNWMKRLNASGITIWLVHHDKKDKGEFDGLNIIAKMPATRIHLTVHPKAQKGEVLVNLAYKKHRDFYGDETADKVAKFNGKRFDLVNGDEIETDDDNESGKPSATVYDFGALRQPQGTNADILQASIEAAGIDIEEAKPVSLANSLNQHGITTAEGNEWNKGTVSNCLGKLKKKSQPTAETAGLDGLEMGEMIAA